MKSTLEITAAPLKGRKGKVVPPHHPSTKMKNHKNAGFTLVELLVVVIIIGLVSIMMSPVYNDLLTAQRSAYDEKHRLNNQLIGASLMSYAANSTAHGRLPVPYGSTIYNPADNTDDGKALTQALTQSAINPGEINSDNTTAQKVRVYQLKQNIEQEIPLYFQTGPKVTLLYDYGAIYLTACPKSNPSCNPNPVSGIPGSTEETLQGSSDYTTWKTTGSDGPAFFISSMPIQKQMLATTTQRLEKVREALLGYLRIQQQTAAGGDKTNWYPNQNGLAAAGSETGKAPGGNQHCRDGWYDLSLPAIKVLPAVGLSQDEYGKTAWGGPIEYCRDYDPIPSAANTPPHYAAIRINKQVTSSASPDQNISGSNIFISF